jgi:hypothetical protein
LLCFLTLYESFFMFLVCNSFHHATYRDHSSGCTIGQVGGHQWQAHHSEEPSPWTPSSPAAFCASLWLRTLQTSSREVARDHPSTDASVRSAYPFVLTSVALCCVVLLEDSAIFPLLSCLFVDLTAG